MERSLFKKSLAEWAKFYLDARTTLIKRPCPPLPSKKIAAALIGVRRCGKTHQAISMTTSLPAEQVVYYNFEDPLFYLNNRVDNLDLLISVAEEFATAKIEVLILDEIQNVDGWERWVRKIVDQKRYRVIVTGSSANLLSSEISTSIAGRCLEYRLWPFSYTEILGLEPTPPASANEHLRLLRTIMTWGAFPEVALTDDISLRKKLLEQYLSDIVLKDVISRHEIRHKQAFDKILTFYLTNISSLHSYASLKKAFAINAETAANYTNALKEAFMVFEVERYHANFKVQTRDPKKIYIVDPGLRTVGARSVTDDTGKLLENLVFLELTRRDKKVFYYRDKQEVDFVVTEKYKAIEAIQVCASNMQDSATFNREVSALVECLTALDLEKGTVITLDREENLTTAGKKIKIKPAYSWLQEKI
ncbi:MAG: ATP-binding protein [Deltaproteobacteria bacterium]|nr:ATP-binding protein [Deltaproteobacteria bacterium]